MNQTFTPSTISPPVESISPGKGFEPNSARIGEVYRENHVAMIDIDWKQQDPAIEFSIIDLDGKKAVTHAIKLSELSFKK